MMFREPIPARNRSKIQGMNMVYADKFGDNQWVTMERLGNGTYVSTTDTYQKLAFDLDTLNPGKFVKFTDDLPYMLGITHSHTQPDGTILSLCPSKGKYWMDNYISIFKMEPDDPLNRKEIAQIPTDYLVY